MSRKEVPESRCTETLTNSTPLIGTIRSVGYNDVDEQLREIQNHLHIVQADFANPNPDEDDPQVREDHVEQLEE